MKADHKMVLTALRTAKGQIEGIMRMVDEDRYCVDISHQLLSTIAILKNTNNKVLHAHLTSCVRESLENNEDIDQKISEVLSIVDKITT
jgi:DNA-binding FrmR family transcriptional regulator